MQRSFERALILIGCALVCLCGCGAPGSNRTPAASQAAAPRIELVDANSSRAAFLASGLTTGQLAACERLNAAARAAVFEVFVAGTSADAPALLGSVTIEPQRLRFTPRYPLEPGLRYRAILRPAKLPPMSGDARDIVTEFAIAPAKRGPATTVETIYPTSDRLPENLLKFYLHFSAPMSRGEAYRHIHLLDADGKTVEFAFLELGEELWDPSLRRFTLLCDPGRVKRGLKPREDLGPVLEVGHDYTLVIDADWPDATGAPLANAARKSFHAVRADNAALDPSTWKIEPPRAGSDKEFVVRFGRSLDHALLGRMLWITDAAGSKTPGSPTIAETESCWRFRPQAPWQSGAYELVADRALEDLAGNSIGRAFDVDVFDEVERTIETRTVSIPWTALPPIGSTE